MSNSAGIIVLACIWFGWPLCWAIVMFCLGCAEVSTVRKLNKHGQRITGKAGYVTITSTRFMGVGTYGIVHFTYPFRDAEDHEHIYTGEQTVDSDLAMRLLRQAKDVPVLFLPRKPYVARLAWTAGNDAGGRPDYKRIKGHLNGGTGIPVFYVGMAVAIMALLLFIRVVGIDNLLGEVIIFFFAAGLCAVLPAWLISKAINRKFLAE